MTRSLFVLTLLIGFSTAQYVQQQRSVPQQQPQQVQAAQPDAIDQIPAWYQMAKPVANTRVQQLPQASPSYYERIEPTYEQRRGEQPTYERPGIQTNQYANYPSYQNRQPYENLNALTSGASLSNLQASRRYPSGASGAGGSDMPYDSALKRYHKLLLKRRQWTTKIGRILASTTPMSPSSTEAPTTTQAPTTTTKKMPKSLKSIYSTILMKTTTTEAPTTTTTTTIRPKVTPRLVGKPRGTFKPHGTRKGWRMWKKVTPKMSGNWNATTTADPVSSTTIPTEPSTSVSTTSPSQPEELPLIEETEVEATQAPEEVTTTETSTTETTTTTEPTTTTTTETTTTESTTTDQVKGGPSPLRPITVGHKWKPLRFKKPDQVIPDTTNQTIITRPKGLRLLEYLLPNTELLAAIKDVVAKFKASLDEAGIDQDVRLMGNQLKNTWQQLRTGPMNEQIGRLFEKAVADAADQKTQQQIQQVQQQLVASRP